MTKSNLLVRQKFFFRSISFLAINLGKTRNISDFPNTYYNSYEFRGIKRCESKKIYSLYENLHQGGGLDWAKKLIIEISGTKLCIGVYEVGSDEPIGISFFYFNKRDLREKTIHEGYSGLKSSLRGKGLGTALRMAAIEHFQENGVGGISSRVSTENIESLRSNLKLGFEVVETYHDAATGDQRNYLVKRF